MADFPCKIVGAGAFSDGGLNVCLTDTSATPAFTEVWFTVQPGAGAQAVLATALTGVAGGIGGGCTVLGTTAGSQLTRLVLLT
jgi:hypothetical protein